MSYQPKEVATRLGVAPGTIRLWSTKFGDFLSDGARKSLAGGGTSLQRRYTDADIALFEKVKPLLATGMTYSQVARRLAGESDLDTEETDMTPVESANEQPAAQALFQQLQSELRSAQRELRTIAGERDAAQARLEGKDEVIAELRSHIETLKAQLDKVQPAAPQAQRSWWRRLLGE